MSCNGPVVSHLQYADDTIFVGNWSSRNIKNMFQLLRCIQLAYGLRVNYSKSNLFGLGVLESEVFSIAEKSYCMVGKFPFKYLGFPIGASMNRTESWAPLVQRFQNKLSNWKAESLSIGGRMQLCKSVLGSLGTYYLSLFKAPKKIISELERIRARFFWGGNVEKRKINWVSWNKVTAHQDVGGLGIGSLRAQNIALLCKWWLRLITEKDNLWGKFISLIHGKQGSISEKFGLGKCSGIWRNVLKIGKDFGSLNISLGTLFEFDPEKEINGYQAWSWRLSSSGMFSVASLRHIIDDLTLPSSPYVLFNWLKIVPKKVNILAWRVGLQRLPTRVNLVKRGIHLINSNCPLCLEVVEDEEHLFLGCKYAKDLIRFIGKWWKVSSNQILNLHDLMEWPKQCGLKGTSKSYFGVSYTRIFG